MRNTFALVFAAILLFVSWPARSAQLCEGLFVVEHKSLEVKSEKNLVPLAGEKSALEQRLLPIALEEGRRLGLSEAETRSDLNFYLTTGIIGGPIHIEALFFGESVQRENYEGLTEEKLLSSFEPYLSPGDRGAIARDLKSQTMSRMARANAFLTHRHTTWSTPALVDSRSGLLLAALYERTLPDTIHSAIAAVPGRTSRIRYQAKQLSYKVFSKAAWAGVFIFPAGLSFHSWEVALGGFSAAYAGVMADVIIRVKQRGGPRSLSDRTIVERARFLRLASRIERWGMEEKALEAPRLTREELAQFDLGETYESLTQNLRFEISKSDFAIDFFAVDPTADKIESTTDEAVSLARLTTTTIEAALERGRLIEDKRSEFKKFLADRNHSPDAVTDSRVETLIARFNHRSEANDLDLEFSFQTLETLMQTLRMSHQNATKLNDKPLIAHLESCIQKLEARERELTTRFLSSVKLKAAR